MKVLFNHFLLQILHLFLVVFSLFIPEHHLDIVDDCCHLLLGRCPVTAGYVAYYAL